MKDIDFDELDKAVNSLMTNVPKSDAPKAEESEKTLDITPTLDKTAEPSFDKLSEATARTTSQATPPKPLAVPSAPPRPSVATRRGGRFMDVVHPSSDMKKPTVPARVSRQGVTISPSPSVEAADRSADTSSAAPQPVDSTPATAPAEPETPTPVEQESVPTVVERAAPKSDWPDPLEMADFKDKPTEEPAEAESLEVEEPPVEKDKTEATSLDPETEPETKPLTSPFLAGTKVEKRPLGGASAPAEEPDRVPVLGDKVAEKGSIDDPNDQLPPSPEEVKTELPEELNTDLVALESDATTSQPTAPEKEETPKWEMPADLEDEKKPEPKPEVSSAPSAPLIVPKEEEKLLPAGPTSIPQQYREEPSSGDQDNGAIYDTDTYHQPLAHPPQKKSGWLWVLWIVVILLLGAGAGAALYFFDIV